MERLSKFRYVEKSVQRIRMIASEFVVKWRCFSFLYGFYSALWWIGWYAHIEKLTMWAFNKKRKFIFSYIRHNHKEIVRMYKDDIIPKAADVDSYSVWVFLGQGFNDAPELVSCCYKNLTSKCKNVHSITMSNYRDYVKIPKEIEDRLSSGDISFTNFSDILRCALLSKYGGLWIDSTCWLVSDIPNDVKQLKFYSIKEFGAKEQAMCSNSNWCAWALGTNEIQNKLFSFVKDIFYDYFKKNRVILDTYFIDYLILFASLEFNDVGESIKHLPSNNEKRNQLHFLLNKQFDKNKYKNLVDGDNWLFKLSYKSQWVKHTEDGELTFYGKLFNE